MKRQICSELDMGEVSTWLGLRIGWGSLAFGAAFNLMQSWVQKCGFEQIHMTFKLVADRGYSVVSQRKVNLIHRLRNEEELVRGDPPSQLYWMDQG